MLKTFLKHFVYEQCIDILFDRICMNFMTDPKIDREKWLRDYMDHLHKTKEYIIPIDKRDGIFTMGLNPYFTKAMKELKELRIQNGTMTPKELNERDEIKERLEDTFKDMDWHVKDIT